MVELFSHSWQALRAAVAALPDEDFDQPSGSAAGRAAALADPALRVSTQDKVLTAATTSRRTYSNGPRTTST
ncbi:hypothetical protein ACFQVA_38995 [Actinomadura keratinilytica]